MEETKLLREHITALAEENKQLRATVAQLTKEKQAAEKKINQQATRLIEHLKFSTTKQIPI